MRFFRYGGSRTSLIETEKKTADAPRYEHRTQRSRIESGRVVLGSAKPLKKLAIEIDTADTQVKS